LARDTRDQSNFLAQDIRFLSKNYIVPFGCLQIKSEREVADIFRLSGQVQWVRNRGEALDQRDKFEGLRYLIDGLQSLDELKLKAMLSNYSHSKASAEIRGLRNNKEIYID
jgi:hypothetical protein